MRVEDGFQPASFPEENPYTSDLVLPALLKRLLPKEIMREVEPDLVRLGNDVVKVLRPLADSHKVTPPRLVQYDQWGQRVDRLETSEGWRELKTISQREGLPGIFYERPYQEHSRTYGFAKMMLMVGDSHVIFCPMSMTDGTARVIELLGTTQMKEKILPRLISRDPNFAFTSGQWMTERPGGSDVSQTETTAVSAGHDHPLGPQYTLNGFKWFSSATDSDVAVALARTGSLNDGSRGLSLFLVPLRKPLLRSSSDPLPSPISNNIFVHRLKNKVGTHLVPTAELSLENSEGYLIGTINQGVKNISPVLNITRLWSAIASVGGLRKCLAIATSYAKVRSVEGGRVLLRNAPVHVAQLSSISLLYRALTHLVFGTILLLGKSECGVATTEELRRLRLLTPIAKAFAAEKACAGMEEAMTALGGAGYMEENAIGRQIRDSLVEKIWEGTTTVLSLDLARAAKDSSTLKAFIMWSTTIITAASQVLGADVDQAAGWLRTATLELSTAYTAPVAALVPRPALLLMGHVASGVYLLEHASWAQINGEASASNDIEVFNRWVCEGGFISALGELRRARAATSDRMKMDSEIVFGQGTFAKL